MKKSNHDSKEVLSDQYSLMKEKIIQLKANYTNLRIDDFYLQVNHLERMLIEIDHKPKAAQLRQDLHEIRDNYESMRRLMIDQSVQRRQGLQILITLLIGFLTVFAMLYIEIEQGRQVEEDVLHWNDPKYELLPIENSKEREVYIGNIELSFKHMGKTFRLYLLNLDANLNKRIKEGKIDEIWVQINPFFYEDEDIKDLGLKEFLDKELGITIRVYMNKKIAPDTYIEDTNEYKYTLKITTFIEFTEITPICLG